MIVCRGCLLFWALYGAGIANLWNRREISASSDDD
eukprot:COSAG02_NODE_58776_length_276_cov_0.802260_1_plen_34_part_10